jgi:hypothetical protein
MERFEYWVYEGRVGPDVLVRCMVEGVEKDLLANFARDAVERWTDLNPS